MWRHFHFATVRASTRASTGREFVCVAHHLSETVCAVCGEMNGEHASAQGVEETVAGGVAREGFPWWRKCSPSPTASTELTDRPLRATRHWVHATRGRLVAQHLSFRWLPGNIQKCTIYYTKLPPSGAHLHSK